MSEPRTRRQLREALELADQEKRAAAAEASTALLEANRQASTANRRASDAEYVLDKLGYERGPDFAIREALGVLDSDRGWIPKAGTPATIPVQTHEKIVDATIGEVQAGTRRETLAAVIDALQIKGDYGRAATADALWADIQVALEVRAERKNAEQRAATEAKVSRLQNRPAFTNGGLVNDLSAGVGTTAFSVPSTGLYRVGVDIVGGGAAASLLTQPDRDLLGDAGPGGSYGGQSTDDKPKTTKKSKGDKK